MKSNQFRLNNGVTIPSIGLGTFSVPYDSKRTEEAVQLALEMGYRHFDTAKLYGSEPAVGKVIKRAILDGKVKREDVFITSKLWGCDHHDPVSALMTTLENLGLEYLDMYLVHWPLKLKPWAMYLIPNEEDYEPLDMETTWAGMEKCLDLGLCRCIGLSNFSSTKIQRLLDFATVSPAVNQVEMHPAWRQATLRGFCAEHKIHVSAYSPLGGPGNSWGSTTVIENPIIKSIALKHKTTPSQVALKWGLSKGSTVIVKSFNPDRMRENLGALNLNLDDQDLLEIEKMEERKILRGDVYCNDTTSPYRTIDDIWDGEI
ncbi:NADP-dependent oxidoreductase domain [Dillenia turbinata]|uniref:NADP-dependent oxidoreductase domain n=1 Tax=Dillenia turbinata TaxID=194707 RepID=A0AAN8VY19_9MAGN